MNKLDKVKKVIKDNFMGCGLYNTRNWTNDITRTIYKQDGVTVDACYEYSYFEVFGLSDEEFKELNNYYDDLLRNLIRQDVC